MDTINHDWINVQTHDGLTTLSPRTVLAHAHEIIDVYGNSTQENYGIKRFLTSLVQAILKPQTLDDIKGTLDLGSFDESLIQNFVKHNPMPLESFYQDPFMTEKLKTIGYLTPDVPSGSSSLHFRHSASDANKVYCIDCCLKALVSLSPWATIYGKGFNASINGAPPMYTIPQGDNLFQTLTMSLIPGVMGIGAWVRPSQRKVFEKVDYLTGLTFMPRRICIDWQTGDTICTRCARRAKVFASQMRQEPGEKYIGDDWRDPFVAYKPSSTNKSKIVPVRAYGQDRNTWDEFAQKSLSEHRSAIMNQWPDHKRWVVYGSVTDKATIYDAWSVTLDLAELTVQLTE